MISTSEIQWNLFRQLRVTAVGGNQYVGKVVRYDQDYLVLVDEDSKEIKFRRDDVRAFKRVKF